MQIVNVHFTNKKERNEKDEKTIKKNNWFYVCIDYDKYINRMWS